MRDRGESWQSDPRDRKDAWQNDVHDRGESWQSDPRDRETAWQNDLQFLDSLNTRGDLYLIRQVSTGRILTGRRVNARQAAIYRRLMELGAPHTPAILEMHTDADGQILVLEEYLQGVTLASRLEDGLCDMQMAARIGMQLCEALSALHAAGLVHRDIKPENVIIIHDNEAYLIDYDIARLQKAQQAQDTAMLGTSGYAAPEQYGFAQTDARADIYALGVLLNQMVTGAFPKDQMAPEPLHRIIRKCTEIAPDNRYQTAAQLRAALQTCGIGDRHASSSSPAKYRRPLPGFRSRNPLIWLAAILFYLVAGLVIASLLAASFESTLNFFIGIPLIAASVATYLFLFDLFGLRSRCRLVEHERGNWRYYMNCGIVLVLIWTACIVVMVMDVMMHRM